MKENFVSLPPEKLRQFGIDLYKGHYEDVLKTIEENDIDINSIFEDDRRKSTLLMKCVDGADKNDNYRASFKTPG